MSEENNLKDSEKETQDQNLLSKGWKNFINSTKDGFNSFKSSLEKQAKKNEELWGENKEKVDGFFNKIKQDWDNQIAKWNTEMERHKQETKEQWEARKGKIQQEIKSWQDKTEKEWNEGIKAVRKGFFKAYLWALIIILPIVLIVIIVLYIINRLLG